MFEGYLKQCYETFQRDGAVCVKVIIFTQDSWGCATNVCFISISQTLSLAQSASIKKQKCTDNGSKKVEMEYYKILFPALDEC